MTGKVNRNHSQIKEQQHPYDDTHSLAEHPFIEERYEIINGIRYDLKPSPTFFHQQFISDLSYEINLTCRPDGTVVVAPMDVYFDDDNIVQPDIIFITHSNMDIIRNGRIEGAPDLLVEVLSPSTSINDKKRKKALYEQYGVKEYWIVDLHHQLLDQFVLREDKFELNNIYTKTDTISAELTSCISIPLSRLFDRLEVTKE